MNRKWSLCLLLLAFCGTSQAAISSQQDKQPTQWNAPEAGNPFIPGYFADPTIRKFGDTYYLYATTDGTGNGYGPAQVWTSKDFRNWTNHLMDWPTTEVVWAPDVMQTADGLYRYFYCEPCVLHEGVGPTPLGPWKNVLGADDAVLVEDRFVHNAITLDGQTFVDDDGGVYIYFGTWGIYDGFGCGVAKFNSDMKSFADKRLIPNTEATDFFEAPFVIKKDGVYYFTYSSGSCHDHTYRVQYATSTVGPMGPYEYQGCILETNDDRTVHGPGHHSILQDGDEYYIVYHRHNIPQATHGFNRQICIDELHFTADGKIEKVVPTHGGVLPKSVRDLPVRKNLAFGAKVTASSFYSNDYLPAYATDDNNATLWKPATCNGKDYLQIDLGEVKSFREVQTQFEFATFYYQYKIETSTDGQQWALYADHTTNTQPGSPMIDEGQTSARYLRIWVTGREMNGHFGGIWNVKVYADSTPDEERVSTAEASKPNAWKQRHASITSGAAGCEGTKSPIVSINAKDYPVGTLIGEMKTNDYQFSGEGVRIELRDGRPAFHFTGSQTFRSDKGLPECMNYSAPYTVEAWVLNPDVDRNECIAQLIPDRHDLSTVELCNGSDPQNGLMMHNASFENSGSRLIKAHEGEWQHWVVTYDGYMERHYLNGRQVSEKNMMLVLRPGRYIQIGASFEGNSPFNGYLHALNIYDRSLSADEVSAQFAAPLDYDLAAAEKLQAKAAKQELKGARLEVQKLTPQLLSVRLVDKAGNLIQPGFNKVSAICVDEFSLQSGQTLIALPEAGKYTIQAIANLNEKGSKKIASKKITTSSEDFKEKTIVDSPEGLTLTSKSRNFNAFSEQNGPFKGETVKGDFVAICRLSDLTGRSQRRTPSYNEGGLMVLDDTNPQNQQIVQMGIFPNYNCGNMLTTVSHHGRRPQFPRGNSWQYDPWLMIERCGNTFIVRTSQDGKQWTETTGSPVEMQMPDEVKVGLFQVTYTDNEASATFDKFMIYQAKETGK
ncbi:MAG: family 43 glycosylhydrolase [Prevotella sp.]|nr:family 43 glycosylhydrolase [Prevotella sp.]